MNWNIEIKDAYVWYRDSTKEWVITIIAVTNSCALSINYANKRLNKAKKSMFRNLANDLMKDEIECCFNDILTDAKI